MFNFVGEGRVNCYYLSCLRAAETCGDRIFRITEI
jgi:hypothetical protein